MSARNKIVSALIEELKTINGSGTFDSNLSSNVFNKLKFWDEIVDYPSLYLNAGGERREYLPGSFKWGFLTVTIRVYVRNEEPELELEKVFSDIEQVIDQNGNLDYDNGRKTEDIKIMSLNTDEGLLAPVGVGEIILEIMYDL